VINHLDGRKLMVSGAPGEVIAPESLKVIENEGMPIRGDASRRGKLFLKFSVEFPTPEQLTPGLKTVFAKVLGLPDEGIGLDENDEDVYPVGMTDGEIRDFNNAQSSREQRQGEAYSRQEDEYEGGHTSSCQPM
jgi:DnaJ family protein A protein 2